MREKDLLYEFVYSDGFLEDVGDLLDEDALHALEDELLENPRRGKTIPGAGGFRKTRAAPRGRGKRGGARVIYYFVDRRATVYFIMAYAKNVKESLAEAEKKALRDIARRLEEENAE